MKLLKGVSRLVGRAAQKIGRSTVIFVLAAALAFSAAVTGYAFIGTNYRKCVTITLNYEGAKKGLNPAGGRFNIGEIKSDEVLKRALEIFGDDSLSVDGVKERIYIDSKMPLTTIEKTKNAIASGSTYSYIPAEFDIYYSQKNKLGKSRVDAFLGALAEAYGEYFNETYSDKNVVLEFKDAESLESYDYQEICGILNDKINSMLTYIEKRKLENKTFRSRSTGYTFENISAMLVNLRDFDLKKFEAFVNQNKISKERLAFMRKLQYRIDTAGVQYRMNNNASLIAGGAMNIYNPNITGVAFIPSIDTYDEYYMGRTKTGLDNLAKRSYSEGTDATRLKKDIDAEADILAKYTAASDTAWEVQWSANILVTNICEYMKRISSIAIQTDNDYMSETANDYITYSFPGDGLRLPLRKAVYSFAFGLFAAAAMAALYRLNRSRLAEMRAGLSAVLSEHGDEEGTE